MGNIFISAKDQVIPVNQHHKFAEEFVMTNYPGHEQYGDPLQRLIQDGWIRIDGDFAELRDDRKHELKNFLSARHSNPNEIIVLTLWSYNGSRYERTLSIKDIMEEF